MNVQVGDRLQRTQKSGPDPTDSDFNRIKGAIFEVTEVNEGEGIVVTVLQSKGNPTVGLSMGIPEQYLTDKYFRKI